MPGPFTGQLVGPSQFLLTAAQWTDQNRILQPWETGIESDTGASKRGDGSTAWATLPYQPRDTAIETLVAAGAISIYRPKTNLAVVGGGAVTLAAPTAALNGLIKVIQMTTDDGDTTLSLANCIGQSSGTTATFNSVDDCLILMAVGLKWMVVKEYGIALA